MHNFTLKFPSLEERKFLVGSYSRRLFHLRVISLVAALVQFIYLLKDIVDPSSDPIIYRTIIILIILLGYSVTFTRFISKYDSRFIFLVVMISSSIILHYVYMIFLNPTEILHYLRGIPILYGLLLFSGLIVRHLYWIGSCFVAMSFFLLVYVSELPGDYAIQAGIIIVVNFMLGLAAAYSFEKTYRQGFLQQITLEKTRGELKRQQEIFTFIVENSVDLILVLNQDQQITFINSAKGTFPADELQELQGKDANEIIDKEYRDSFDRDFYMSALSGKSYEGELRLRFSNGENRWVYCKSSPLRKFGDENDIKIILYLRDISKSKEWQDKILQVNRDLSQLNESKTRFFGIISHDLKGSIGTMAALLQFMKKELNQLNPQELEEFVNNLEISAGKSYKLLMDLLVWAKSQLTTSDVKKEWFDLRQASSEALESAMDSGKETVRFENNVRQNSHVFLERMSIVTILRNLVANASKYTVLGSISINANINSKEVQIVVSDTGQGMSQDRIKQLLQTDEITSTPGVNNEQGTGFGLVMCKELVSRNGGELKIESLLGKGTTIKLTFPAIETKDVQLPQVAEEVL